MPGIAITCDAEISVIETSGAAPDIFRSLRRNWMHEPLTRQTRSEPRG
jgi:hypothetical protein